MVAANHEPLVRQNTTKFTTMVLQEKQHEIERSTIEALLHLGSSLEEKGPGTIAEFLRDRQVRNSVTTCPLCGEVIFNGRSNYDFFSPIPNAVAGRGEKHCRDKHPNRWVWNFVPHIDHRIKIDDPGFVVDALICEAMTQAGPRVFPLPPIQQLIAYTVDDVVEIARGRLASAMTWLGLVYPKSRKLRQIERERFKEAIGILRLLWIPSSPLRAMMEAETEMGRINLLLLLSSDPKLWTRLRRRWKANVKAKLLSQGASPNTGGFREINPNKDSCCWQTRID